MSRVVAGVVIVSGLTAVPNASLAGTAVTKEYCADAPVASVAIRATPTRTGKVIATAPNGECGIFLYVNVSVRKGGFVYVRYGSKTGWAQSDYLSEPVEVPTTTTARPVVTSAPAPSTAAPTPSTAAPSTTAAPKPTATTPSAPVGTSTNPIPAGTTGRVNVTGGYWLVTIDSYLADATAAVVSRNMFNSQPANGNVFGLATLRVGWYGTGTGDVGAFGLGAVLFGPDGIGRDAYCHFNVVPNELRSELLNTAVLTGNLCFETPAFKQGFAGAIRFKDVFFQVPTNAASTGAAAAAPANTSTGVVVNMASPIPENVSGFTVRRVCGPNSSSVDLNNGQTGRLTDLTGDCSIEGSLRVSGTMSPPHIKCFADGKVIYDGTGVGMSTGRLGSVPLQLTFEVTW